MSRHKSWKMMTAGILALMLSIGIGGSAQAYTINDVVAAKGNTPALKMIADDAETEVPVRQRAILSMPMPEILAYIDGPLAKSNVTVRSRLFFEAANANALPVNRYEEAFVAAVGSGATLNAIHVIHTNYIKALVAAEQYAKALSESRRLFGRTPPRSSNMNITVNAISSAIKAENFARTNSAREAVDSVNKFLTDIKDGTSTHAWFSIAYPATPAAITTLETNDNLYVATNALLFSGKYDQARASADSLFTVSTDTVSTQNAIYLIAQSINGKAQRPSAANEFLSQFQG